MLKRRVPFKEISLVFVTATLTLICTRSVGPAWAGEGVLTGGIIDKEFEVALRKHFEKRFFSLIEADGAQRNKIDSLLSQRQEETRPLREQFREGLKELRQMMAGDSADEQIQQKIQDLRSLHNKIADARIDTALKIRANLSPEQRKTVSEHVSCLLSGGRWRGGQGLGL